MTRPDWKQSDEIFEDYEGLPYSELHEVLGVLVVAGKTVNGWGAILRLDNDRGKYTITRLPSREHALSVMAFLIASRALIELGKRSD